MDVMQFAPGSLSERRGIITGALVQFKSGAGALTCQ